MQECLDRLIGQLSADQLALVPDREIVTLQIKNQLPLQRCVGHCLSTPAMGWPAIPNAPVPDGKLNSIVDHDLGDTFHYADTSGVVSVQPPRFRQFIPSLVPRVNADGNETAGVPSVQPLVPLGTYVVWNEIIDGFNRGQGFTLAGGFIPFARTREARVASKDPRLSLEERYGGHAGFVRRVREVVAEQVAQGWPAARGCRAIGETSRRKQRVA